jgi:hypothetical protein
MDNAELDKHIETLKKCEYISDANAVKRLCDKAKEILSKQDNIIYLDAPITVRNKIITINKFFRFVVISMGNFMIY